MAHDEEALSPVAIALLEKITLVLACPADGLPSVRCWIWSAHVGSMITGRVIALPRRQLSPLPPSYRPAAQVVESARLNAQPPVSELSWRFARYQLSFAIAGSPTQDRFSRRRWSRMINSTLRPFAVRSGPSDLSGQRWRGVGWPDQRIAGRARAADPKLTIRSGAAGSARARVAYSLRKRGNQIARAAQSA